MTLLHAGLQAACCAGCRAACRAACRAVHCAVRHAARHAVRPASRPANSFVPGRAACRPARNPARRANPRQRGVTLVELVVVLTLMGLVASIGATLVTRTVAGQQDNRGRLTLAMAGDAALARVADELQAALPNSVRVAASGAETWIEWVPVSDAGRWRAAPDTASGTAGDSLDLDDASDAAFDVIGTPVTGAPAGSQLVLQNLGTAEADAYAGTSRRGGLVVSAAGRHIAFTAAGALPNSVGSQRFFIVGTPLTLACRSVAGGGFELRRYAGYGWLTSQPVNSAGVSGGSSALLLGGLASCSASYGSALANIGLLNLQLGLADGQSSARMRLLAQLPIDNTP